LSFVLFLSENGPRGELECSHDQRRGASAHFGTLRTIASGSPTRTYPNNTFSNHLRPRVRLTLERWGKSFRLANRDIIDLFAADIWANRGSGAVDPQIEVLNRIALNPIDRGAVIMTFDGYETYALFLARLF
jgi:hypothetical protein